jgi:Uma2 family endonuclease
MKSVRWTSQDLEALPDDGKRYEIIDGELYMSRQPHYNHQLVSARIIAFLTNWSLESDLGQATTSPGLIFSEDDDVAPDVVWISNERLAAAIEPDGKLHIAPELAIEVLSPGTTNETRDREVKRKLYSRRGVSEYWIISWPKRQIEVYRRNPDTASLELIQTLYESDTLKSSILPGFKCELRSLFKDLV